MKRLLILLMLVSQPAWAEWVELGRAGSGPDMAVTVYFDPETLRKTHNGRREWAMHSFDQRQTRSWGTFQSVKSLNEFDCGGERTRSLQLVWYSGPMGEGRVVSSDNSPDEWIVGSPGSIAEAQLKAVCRVPLK